MELWIRSQDKERLSKVVEVYYSKDDYGYYIMVNQDKFTGYKFGTYKTKERALEVLDEITDFIDGLNKTNTITIYEMPKE